MSEKNDLDALLLAWLSEPDDRCAELRFNEYYQCAFRRILRYIHSIGPTDGIDVEEIAQHALLKLFNRIGRERREAAEIVGSSIDQFHASRLGSHQERTVHAWQGRVRSAINAAVQMQCVVADSEWRDAVKYLNDQITDLAKQGQFLLAALSKQGNDELVGSMNRICGSLPLIKIPTNGLLFIIAKRRYVDIMRALKPSVSTEDVLQHTDEPLYPSLASDIELPAYQEDVPNDDFVSAEDPEMELDSENGSLYAAFLRHLLAKVPDGDLIGTLSGGRDKSARRLIEILKALDGDPQPTEAEIAQRMGLSRNQVKYAIERLREEFHRFAPALSQEASNRRKIARKLT